MDEQARDDICSTHLNVSNTSKIDTLKRGTHQCVGNSPYVSRYDPMCRCPDLGSVPWLVYTALKAVYWLCILLVCIIALIVVTVWQMNIGHYKIHTYNRMYGPASDWEDFCSAIPDRTWLWAKLRVRCRWPARMKKKFATHMTWVRQNEEVCDPAWLQLSWHSGLLEHCVQIKLTKFVRPGDTSPCICRRLPTW